ncbi:MAG TPA: hypothetical protein VFR97_03305 [Capillimicrobium sp.]|nr:hypothetical protein [Capillimicrobium sp.]
MSQYRRTAVAAALFAAALAAVPAQATPPGSNGLIVWQREGRRTAPHLWVANPDGSGAREVFRGTRHQAEFEGTFDPTDPNVMFFSRGAAPFEPFVEDLVRGDLRTGAVTRIGFPNAADIAPTVSPDGTKLAWFAVPRAPLGENKPPPPMVIRVANVDGSGMRRLTARRGLALDPDWSPDGTRLAFTQVRVVGDRGQNRIAIMNADGSGLRALTPYGGPDEINPKWTPDGRNIMFERAREHGRRSAIAVVPPTGGRPRIVYDSPAWDTNPIPSPDGTRILFTSDRHDPRRNRINPSFELYTMRVDGADVTRLTHNRIADIFPDWQRLP